MNAKNKIKKNNGPEFLITFTYISSRETMNEHLVDMLSTTGFES